MSKSLIIDNYLTGIRMTGRLSGLQIVEAKRQSSSDSLLNLSRGFLKGEVHLVQSFISMFSD